MSHIVLFASSSAVALYHVLRHLRFYWFISWFIPVAVSSWSITVLEWAGILAEYALWSRMSYLTIVLKLDTTHAATIVNVYDGVATIMPIAMAFLVDAFVGDYYMLLFSSFAYSFGMILLAMSALGNCAANTPVCIGEHTQQVLFYILSVFIAIGISGHTVSLSSFLEQQKPAFLEQQQPTMIRISWKFTIIALFYFLILMLDPDKSMFVIFGISAIGMTVATFLFVTHSSGSYKYAKPQGSPLTVVSRVFVASASKIFCPLPHDANQLHENRSSSHYVPHTHGLRCLDKAAIVVPTQTLEQQEKNRWKLCSVTEVEETKIFIRMIPIWIIFIMCGVVLSVGDTFFLDQADNLNGRIGIVTAPTFTLQIFQKLAKSMFARVTMKLAKNGSVKYAAPFGMIIAMLFSILCCITAAKVETKRLDMVKSHRLLDKPYDEIPMSMFWLLPQFLLLGAVDGISHNLLGDCDGISGFSIACFFNGKVPDSISSYLLVFSDSVFGIGSWGSGLLVYIVGMVSQRGSKPSWFQETLNKSRLDNYYWTLAVWSSISLVFSILMAIWYIYQHSKIEEIRTTESQSSGRP